MPADPETLRQRRVRLANRFSWAVGVMLLLVAVAGSDHPPPPGFLWIVILVGAVWWALRLGIPALLGVWDARGRATALMLAGAAGLLLGVLAWVALSLVQLVSGSAELPDAASLLVGFAVIGALGAGGALVLAALVRLIDRR